MVTTHRKSLLLYDVSTFYEAGHHGSTLCHGEAFSGPSTEITQKRTAVRRVLRLFPYKINVKLLVAPAESVQNQSGFA